LPAIVGVAACLFAAGPAAAGWAVRVTEESSTGVVEASQTLTGGVTGNPATNSFNKSFSAGGDAPGLPDFTVVLTSNLSTTGGGITGHSETLNISYSGPTAPSDKLLVEILGDGYVNPAAGIAQVIQTNASPSQVGLAASSVNMTSGVVNGNVGLSGSPGTTLATLGTVSINGTMGAGSTVLQPNNASGPGFAIANPFTFYQSFLLSSFTNNGTGSISAGTQVSAVPAPAGVLLVMAGLPVLGGFSWMRRRKAAQAA
jgi:hypothetical protein